MEPKNPTTTTTSADTRIDVSLPDPKQHVSFTDQPDEFNTLTAPFLVHPRYARSKSLIHDELHSFRICLKWLALDHSSHITKSVSYFTFVLLTIVVPAVSSFYVHVPPAAATPEDPISLNDLVQLPQSALASIAFLTLTNFFRQSGLRQLLFLDRLQDDSQFVRCGYARELDKAFRHLVYILLPSCFVELAHKILFFLTVTVSATHLVNDVQTKSVLFIAALASWVYRSGVFLLVCVFFRLTCELQILRFEGFKKLFEGCGEDAVVMFREHMRIRKQLSVTSHMYRIFIIMCSFAITVGQFGALFLVLTSKSEKSFFNAGELVVCSAVQLSGFFLCLMGATRITHRAQGIVSVATRWHMHATSRLNAGLKESTATGIILEADENKESTCANGLESSNDFITIPAQNASSYQTRLALVTYLAHNNGGITVFGFALDRGFLHTLFAFEFSLVMWILSKVVVLSQVK